MKEFEQLEKRLCDLKARQKDDAVVFISRRHNLELAREFLWAHDAVALIGFEDFDIYSTTRGPLDTGYVPLRKPGPQGMATLKHEMWVSKIDHYILLEKARFHKTEWAEAPRLKERFEEEQKGITAKMVTYKMRYGSEDQDQNTYAIKYGKLLADEQGLLHDAVHMTRNIQGQLNQKK